MLVGKKKVGWATRGRCWQYWLPVNLSSDLLPPSTQPPTASKLSTPPLFPMHPPPVFCAA